MKNILSIAFALLLASAYTANAQTDKETAKAKGAEAIELMDNDKLDESIALLKEAQKLDPENYVYRYETALAVYRKGDFKEAITLLTKLMDHKDVSRQLYQLLGNAYDLVGKDKKAFEIYDKGLERFPNAGELFLEKGNVYWSKKEYEKALPFYEAGIQADPSYPSNYYRAALIFCSSQNEAWGMIYGEIFMNLEPNSKRTAAMSKLLYDTYKSEIKFPTDTTITTSFGQPTLVISDVKDLENLKIPFLLTYETLMTMSLVGIREININTLDDVRERFVQNYYQMGHDKKYPNALFQYQDKILKAGHLEAYNHWILMKGDEDAFDQWNAGNAEKWDAFVKWFADNGIALDDTNKFYRGQY